MVTSSSCFSWCAERSGRFGARVIPYSPPGSSRLRCHGAALLAWAGDFERLADLRREGPRIVQVMTGLTLGVGIYAAQLHDL